MLKSILIKSLIVFNGTVLVAMANAQSTQVKIQSGAFVAVYTDSKNNLAWSKALPGTYTNGCLDAHGKYDANKCTWPGIGLDSAAGKACKEIGASLPTKFQYESLIRSFGHHFDSVQNVPFLTEKGQAQMQAVFGDMPNYFWTSSVYSMSYPQVAFFFHSPLGHALLDRVRDNELAVRCVLQL